jgi:N-acetyl-1-D-myo-inositol-2-amino-2-deoxy-alpha-D-glucopyranoside deacetylase
MRIDPGHRDTVANSSMTMGTVKESQHVGSRRLLVVHAHPDDESIDTGATMALYAASGAQVTLITCTLGEEGEILTPKLAHLAADRDDRLGQHRLDELAAACVALGVTDHRVLGGPGRWRDSGMNGTGPNHRPNVFVKADEHEVVRELVAVLREVRPQVVVTYSDSGGKGHPDHIKAHQATVAAFDASADRSRYPDAGEPWRASKLYWSVVAGPTLRHRLLSTSAWRQLRPKLKIAMQRSRDQRAILPRAIQTQSPITTRIDGSIYLEIKLAALRAYPTQLKVKRQFFTLAHGVKRRATGIEWYILARGKRGPVELASGLESDLFAGI